MNKPNELPLPTPAELTLLQILWKCGPSSVREVHAALGRDVAYTSVLKQLQNMHGKQLVTRQDDARAHVYEAAEPRDRVERRAVSDLAARMFGGSPEQLAMRALSLRKSSSAELEQLRRLLDPEGEGMP
jgi:predicted transcriptional regulator